MSMEDYELNEQRYSEKTHLVTLLLAWFLGMFGAHRFYTGKIGSGIAMAVLTITGFLAFVSGIWAFVDLIMIVFNKFKDAEGKELADYSPGCAMIALGLLIVGIILAILATLALLTIGS